MSQSSTLDPRAFAERMTQAVWSAAGIARRLEGNVPNTPKSGEENDAKAALTEADEACQECILQGLLAHFPEVSLAAEEDTPGVAHFPRDAPARVVIDPIDGTLHSYLNARGPYSVIVGLVVNGVYEAGLVALPREGLLFRAARGCGVERLRANGPAKSVESEADGDRLLVTHGTPDAVHEWLAKRGHEVVGGSGGAVPIAPLLRGFRGGLRVASGPTGISIRGRVGAVIARESGALLEGDGAVPFPEDDATPCRSMICATDPEVQDLLRAALAENGIEPLNG